ncbi:MAG: hypothetical protein NTZ74_12725 [Chloroflexi bacterium]|nr:hypothetical protein [Chloroflexota bacterium]
MTEAQYEQTLAIMDSLKGYGAVYVLTNFSKKSRLAKILSEAMSHHRREVLTLACSMIISDKPMMYCSDRISSIETLSVSDLSSQRISELRVAFGAETRHTFFEGWTRHLSERVD